MSFVKKVLLAAIAAAILSISIPATAQPPGDQKCEGPSDLCSQIVELKARLEEQKAQTEKKTAEKDTATAEKDTARAETKTSTLQTEKKDAENVARMLALAAILAVALKALMSVLQSWKGFFTTDKQKAWLKVTTLFVGLLAFLASNIGFGIPWWQSVILAGGGPGAIMVHELLKLLPVLRGKQKLADAEAEARRAAEEEHAAEEGRAS